MEDLNPNPMWRRMATYVSAVAGMLCLLLIAGFFIGKGVYNSAYGSQRPGFDYWCRIYRPVLFRMARNEEAWRYRDLDREQWLEAKCESFDPGWHYVFLLADGRKLYGQISPENPFDPADPLFDIKLKPGHAYRIKIRVVIEDNSLWLRAIVGDDELSWSARHQVLEVVELP